MMKNTVGAMQNLWLNVGGLHESTHGQIQDCPLAALTLWRRKHKILMSHIAIDQSNENYKFAEKV